MKFPAVITIAFIAVLTSFVIVDAMSMLERRVSQNMDAHTKF